MALQEFTCTGEGSADFGDYLNVEHVGFDIVTPGPLTEYRSNTNPKRVMHVGWIALGQLFGDGPDKSVNWFKYVEFERENVTFDVLKLMHHLIWHVEAGTTLHVAVFY